MQLICCTVDEDRLDNFRATKIRVDSRSIIVIFFFMLKLTLGRLDQNQIRKLTFTELWRWMSQHDTFGRNIKLPSNVLNLRLYLFYVTFNQFIFFSFCLWRFVIYVLSLFIPLNPADR